MMSIALSAVITPSRMARGMLAAYALGNGGAGLALLIDAPASALWPQLAGIACLLVALLAGAAARRAPTPRRIDISGLGEVRLTVQQSVGATHEEAVLMRLLPGSTLWPGLLLLRLQPHTGGAVQVLAVWPDSVGPGQFRAFSVASRVIAGRDHKFSEKNKIL